MKRNNQKRAFTIVELVIVIAVIAILAAVLIPTYTNLVKKANAASALSDAKNLVTDLLTNMLSDGNEASDIVIVTKRGDDAYIHGYDASAGQLIAYKNNPVQLTGDGDFYAQAKATCEGLDAFDTQTVDAEWATEENLKKTAEAFGADKMAVFANFKILSLTQTVTRVTSFETFNDNRKDGGYFILDDDITITKQMDTFVMKKSGGYMNANCDSNVTVDLNGKTITSNNKKGYPLFTVGDGINFTITGNGKIVANNLGGIFNAKTGGKITIENGTFEAEKAEYLIYTESGTVIINDGTFTAKDNAVIMTNGNPGKGNNYITINGGTFNAGMQTAGYIPCGVYFANTGVLNVNGGTFNVGNGVGILVRSGTANIGANVTINRTGTGSGDIGNALVATAAEIVAQKVTGYSGTPTVNNSSKYTTSVQN